MRDGSDFDASHFDTSDIALERAAKTARRHLTGYQRRASAAAKKAVRDEAEARGRPPRRPAPHVCGIAQDFFL